MDEIMSLEEGNKLIAEFMLYDYAMYSKWIDDEDSEKDRQIETPLTEYDLEYHTSWDWLMPVVYKIGRIQYDDVKGLREYMSEYWRESEVHIFCPIETIYEAVIKFIQWYNKTVIKPPTQKPIQ